MSNVDGDGYTVRLEIRRTTKDRVSEARSADGTLAVVYRFCLQLGRDQTFEKAGADSSVFCAEGESRGLSRTIWGYYEPRTPSDGARSGAGEIWVDFEAFRVARPLAVGERGLLALVYDFTAGGEAKQISIDWSGMSHAPGTADRFAYEYGRTLDGHVDFYLQVADNRVGGGWTDLGSTALELATIDAAWREGDLGRADVVLENGDIRPGESATATECWDAEHRRTYYRFEFTQNPAWNEQEGDPDACPDL